MEPAEQERRFLSFVGGYLVSLPFDLKVLQEAVTDENLERPARDMAAGAIVHALLPQEGDKLLAYVDDVLLVRAAPSSTWARPRVACRRLSHPIPSCDDVLSGPRHAQVWSGREGRARSDPTAHKVIITA